jgi:hypothetical protein
MNLPELLVCAYLNSCGNNLNSIGPYIDTYVFLTDAPSSFFNIRFLTSETRPSVTDLIEFSRVLEKYSNKNKKLTPLQHLAATLLYMELSKYEYILASRTKSN